MIHRLCDCVWEVCISIFLTFQTVHDPHFLREPFAVRGSMQIDEELSELGVLGTLDQVFHSTPPMKRYLIQYDEWLLKRMIGS